MFHCVGKPFLYGKPQKAFQRKDFYVACSALGGDPPPIALPTPPSQASQRKPPMDPGAFALSTRTRGTDERSQGGVTRRRRGAALASSGENIPR
jgi:hypothetical protein